MKQIAANPTTTTRAAKFFRSLAFLFLMAALPASAQSVKLVWTASSNPAETGFKIYYGAKSRTYTNSLTVGDVTNAVVSGLVAGRTYYFGIKSCDVAGHQSTFSQEIVAVIPAAVPVANKPPVTVGTSPLPAKPATSNLGKSSISTVVKTPAIGTVSIGGSIAAIAKAKLARPVTVTSPVTVARPVVAAKSSPVQPAAVVPGKAPLAQPANVVLVARKNISKKPTVNADAQAADELAARAQLFYAAVSVFDANADGKLDDEAQAKLTVALKNKLPVAFVSVGNLSAAEAPNVTAWAAALYAQIAPLDKNRDGELQPTEQATLVAALLADQVALPIFAPLMLEKPTAK